MANSTTCAKPWQAVSNGVFQGHVPIHFALPLLIIQIVLVLVVTRSLGILFKPLRQPRVLAEVIGGVLLGPSGLGHSKLYLQKIFPEESMPLLDTMANLGLLFFLFMVGLELDLKEIRKSGKTVVVVAVAGMVVPFLATLGIAVLVKQQLLPDVDYVELVVFMGVPLSITAFPVLVRIMAERKLLKTEVGQLVLPAAAMNDVCAWVLLALGVALSGSNKKPITPVLVLLCGVGFVAFMLTLTRKFMTWVAKRATDQDSMSEIYVSLTLMGVLICGFTTDAIGIHPLFGAFFFGLIIPKEDNFAEMMIQKIEDFVVILMLPLFFASSGLKTNLGTINNATSVGFLVLFVATAAFGKIGATIVVAHLSGMTDYRKSVSLGFLMNTKGLVELIVLNIGRDLKVFNDEVFAILVLMCLLSSFMTTPVVIALYNPACTHVPFTNRRLQNLVLGKDQLRMMACLQSTKNVPSMISLIEASAGARKKPFLKVFVVHVTELSNRPSTILWASRLKRRNRSSTANRIFVAFETFAQVSKAVIVRTLMVMSELADMHEDICSTAAEKKVNLIILPFHKFSQGGELVVVNPGFDGVNQKVLRYAPCSVAIFVDRGLGLVEATPQHIAVLFFGGADDREALAMGARLAEQPNIGLSIIRFMPHENVQNETDHRSIDSASAVKQVVRQSRRPNSIELKSHAVGQQRRYQFSITQVDTEQEKRNDDEVLQLFLPFMEHSEEVIADNPAEVVAAIARSGRFCLLLVGRGRYPSAIIAKMADRPADCPELGPVGDILTNLSITTTSSPASTTQSSSSNHQLPSILVVQQYDPGLPNEAPSSKENDDGSTLNVPKISNATSTSTLVDSSRPLV